MSGNPPSTIKSAPPAGKGSSSPAREAPAGDHSGPRREPTMLARSLVAALAPLPLPDRERLLLIAAWPDAVGPEVARNTRPLHLDRGTVLVEVAHEAWAHAIRSNEPAIVERLASRAGLAVLRLSTQVRRHGGCR